MKDLNEAMCELRTEIDRIMKVRFRTPMSGNVPADAAERLSDRPTLDETFDEFVDEHVGAVVPYELQKAVQGLLTTLYIIKTSKRIGTFDGPSAITALNDLLPDLEKLREGCADRFKDL